VVCSLFAPFVSRVYTEFYLVSAFTAICSVQFQFISQAIYFAKCFLMISQTPLISESTGLIFMIFSSNNRYLVADYRSDPLFHPSRDIAMATNFGAKFSYQPSFSN